jgi:hypothetical protein
MWIAIELAIPHNHLRISSANYAREGGGTRRGIAVMTEREIFVEAFQEPDPIARGAFLDRICEGDTALRARVEVLLKKAAEAGRFLEPPDATGGPAGS